MHLDNKGNSNLIKITFHFTNPTIHNAEKGWRSEMMEPFSGRDAHRRSPTYRGKGTPTRAAPT